MGMCLSPVLGIAREPRWGRTEETLGEDTYLASRMAVGYVSFVFFAEKEERKRARKECSHESLV